MHSVGNVPPLSQKKGMHRLMSIVFKGVFTCAFKCILPKLCRFEKGKLNHMWHLVTCVCMMLIVLLPIFLLMSFTKQNNELTPTLDSGFFVSFLIWSCLLYAVPVCQAMLVIARYNKIKIKIVLKIKKILKLDTF